MTAASETAQTISRLTPLNELLTMLDATVKPVGAREIAAKDAYGRILAADVVAATRPAAPLALQDGWAVAAEATFDAGSYAPAALASVPPRIEAGHTMPAGTDAVMPLDAVIVRGGRGEAIAAVAPGEGVLPAGADCDPTRALRRAGERLRLTDAAVFAAVGLARVSVRAPRMRIAPVRAGDAMIAAAAELIARDIDSRGGTPVAGGRPTAALQHKNADAVIVVGGTGSGRNDTSVRMLADAGRVRCHGVGLTPGETAAFGEIDGRPVLLLPGRLDAALAVWLVIGRRLLARCTGATEQNVSVPAALSRKIASTVGLAEVVPVRRNGDRVEPLASKYLSLSVLALADGWILVPAESEGYAAGATVMVRAWP